jgi:hypothetical protein
VRSSAPLQFMIRRPRAAAPPRGGGRSRDVEAMVLREGAFTADLIAQTVVVRAASLEEDRGHVSRIAGRRDRARADEARLAEVLSFQ